VNPEFTQHRTIRILSSFIGKAIENPLLREERLKAKAKLVELSKVCVFGSMDLEWNSKYTVAHLTQSEHTSEGNAERICLLSPLNRRSYLIKPIGPLDAYPKKIDSSALSSILLKNIQG